LLAQVFEIEIAFLMGAFQFFQNAKKSPFPLCEPLRIPLRYFALTLFYYSCQIKFETIDET
jgi:hypothetical protein